MRLVESSAFLLATAADSLDGLVGIGLTPMQRLLSLQHYSVERSAFPSSRAPGVSSLGLFQTIGSAIRVAQVLNAYGVDLPRPWPLSGHEGEKVRTPELILCMWPPAFSTHSALPIVPTR
jgi:hypothetical protein